MPVNNKTSFSILYVLLAIFAVVLVHDFIVAMQKVEELPYSEFKTLLAAGKVAEITVTQQRLAGKLKSEGGSKEPKLFTTVRVDDPDLVKELNAHNVTFSGVVESTFLRDLLSWIVPTLIFVGIWIFVIRRFGQGQQGGFMTVGKSKAKIYVEQDIKVTFADVAGVDEAKDELREVVEFLKTRPLIHILGGHIELDTAGHAYRFGSRYHPNEHRLELARQDLTALPAAFESFNGFYARHSNYILTNPIRNLVAGAIIAVAVLIFIVWGVRRWLRLRRKRPGS